MADNSQIYNGNGDMIATDDIDGIKYQRAKLVHGVDGTNDGDVAHTNPLPVYLAELRATGTLRDAFGRLRVSSPQVLGFGTSEYGLNATFIETKVNGSGAVASLPNESSISLTNGGGTDGHYAYAATKQFHRYVPGRSQLVRWTGTFGTPTANVRQRAGYFSDRNGCFLEYDGEDLYFVRRTYTGGTVEDIRTPRADWADPFDGTGPSGINLDLTKTWLAWLDLEWLGVGRYRFGFASPLTGELLTAYAAAGANVLAVPYMTTANLPVRFEIHNTGAASAVTMKWICYSVDSEGGDEGQIPIQVAVDSGVTPKSVPSGSYQPIIAIRAKETGPNSVPNRGQLVLRDISAMVTGSSSIHCRVILNPTTLTANGGAVSWGAAGSLSEFATFTAAGDTVSGGTVVSSFYVAASASQRGQGAAELFRRLPLVVGELAGTQDVIVLAAQSLGTASNTLGAITVQEVF